MIISLGFIAIGFIINDAWPYYVAFGVGTLTLISKNIAELIVKLWFGLAKILGYVNSRILLTLVYYLILLPFAFMARLSKKQALNLNKQKETYFSTRDHLYIKEDFEKPW